MAAACSWKTCEEKGDESYIVTFSNGHLNKADKLDFEVFKHTDGSNPRKKNRRIVVAESDRIPYVGNNFGPESMQYNNMFRYFVGVLDKRTMQMNIHNAQMFNLLPLIPGEETVEENKNQPETFREKVDALIEAFGTSKQKRALNSRRLNEVGNETLQQAVALAASNVIERKGVEALQNEVAEAQTDGTLFLPPCNTKAETPADVYPFDQLLSSHEFDSLKDVALKMSMLTPEELEKMRAEECPQTVLKHLETLPQDACARDRLSRCAWYLSFLIKASHQKHLTAKFGYENACPKIIINKVLKNFTVESFHKGSIRNTVSKSMRMKLAAHCLAILLHMGAQTANLTLLHRDMGISDGIMLEVAKAMGLKLSHHSALQEHSGVMDEQKIVSLVLPLVCYERRPQIKKRKRMK
ncbi:hypothetical protein DNTS_030149 [Danionella cerebrum]|uniref:RNA polymerase I subunit E n=1 Tax=Danionella cerebrum TaxID=2873325 RepID=A0A553NH00_9TELE|nr:hypothetical protein DNTS_030149 [Danionella translucida]